MEGRRRGKSKGRDGRKEERARVSQQFALFVVMLVRFD